MNVKQKIWFGFGSILALVAVGSGISIYKSYEGERASTRLVRDYLAEFRAINDANEDLAATQLHEQRFLTDKSLDDAKGLKARAARMKEHFGIAIAATPDQTRKDAIAKVSAAVADYATAFERLEHLMVRRGLTPDSGLEGELRGNVHQVETKVKEQNLPALNVLLLTARRHEKDYLLRGDAKYLDELKATVAQFGAQMQQLSLPAALQQELNAKWQSYSAAMQAVVEADREARTQRDALRQLGASIDDQLNKIVASTTRDMESAGVATLGTLTGGRRIVSAAGLLCLAVGLTVAPLVVRGISRPLRSMADKLASAAEQTVAAASQFSGSSQSLASGATQQAASLEETSAALEEVASMAKRNADNATAAKDLSHQTRSAADAGAMKIAQMTKAMDAIKDSSDGISKIIKTIDEIAFQTNILALNAAVEAARAGEAGAGFAVVADEVRNLARRAAESAKETAVRIEDSTEKSTAGVAISQDVAHTLGEILEKARQVDTLVAEIAQASNEQTQGLAQVNLAVAQMDKIVQGNASTAEESASAAEELNAQAGAQTEAVRELRELIGADAPEPAAGLAAAPAPIASPRRLPSSATAAQTPPTEPLSLDAPDRPAPHNRLRSADSDGNFADN